MRDRDPGTPSAGGRAPGPRLVLAVDDEPTVLAVLRRVLGGLPIQLVCCETAEEALDVVRVRTPSAVVCDHRLPGLSGLEMLLEVRRRWPQVPTLLHTCDREALERAARLRLPAVEKGASPDALREMVWRLVDGGAGR